ncbi:MAG: hypothetical protein NTV34_04690, partial [Proteobacteria bacterium]|nr:hypothetical protein [Pseudomonadota bacterium]
SLTNVSSGKARLPTREEYENLLKEFDHTMTSKGKPRLTKRGLDHFSSKIDDMLNDRNYTSSSVEVTENVDDSGAKVLEANAVYQLTLGQLSNYYWNRIIPARVRCVLDPLH